MPTGDPLSELLQSWRHEPRPEPGFGTGVWDRVAAGRRAAASAAFHRWALPLAASAALLAGSAAAIESARHQHNGQMAAAYARSVDPLQMSGSPSP